MKNKKKIIIISAVGVAVLSVVLILTLVCFHSWTDATCDAPMTCKKCGKTKGEAISPRFGFACLSKRFAS